MTRLLFDVPAKLEAHGGKNLAGEVVFAARGEALVERGSEDWSRSGGLDCRKDGPAAFTGVGNAAGEAFECRLLQKGDCGEVEQPGCHDATAAPDFGDVGKIEIVLIVFR